MKFVARVRCALAGTLAVSALLVGCSAGVASDKTEPANTIEFEGTIQRSMTMAFTDSPGRLEAGGPSEEFVTKDGAVLVLQRAPDCKVTDRPSEPGVIQLGQVGSYRCRGVMNGNVFVAHEITRLD